MTNADQPGTVLNPETGEPFRARDLKVVDNTTPEYMGGFTVECGDWIVAGPYAAKVDADPVIVETWM